MAKTHAFVVTRPLIEHRNRGQYGWSRTCRQNRTRRKEVGSIAVCSVSQIWPPRAVRFGERPGAFGIQLELAAASSRRVLARHGGCAERKQHSISTTRYPTKRADEPGAALAEICGPIWLVAVQDECSLWHVSGATYLMPAIIERMRS